MKFYLITELGTLVCLHFDFLERAVRDVRVNAYIKSMVEFRLVKIKASENLDVCMLIEHDCLCQIRFWAEQELLFDVAVTEGGEMANLPQPKFPSIMNEQEMSLA